MIWASQLVNCMLSMIFNFLFQLNGYKNSMIVPFNSFRGNWILHDWISGKCQFKGPKYAHYCHPKICLYPISRVVMTGNYSAKVKGWKCCTDISPGRVIL